MAVMLDMEAVALAELLLLVQHYFELAVQSIAMVHFRSV
jgi:hypothetical protein